MVPKVAGLISCGLSPNGGFLSFSRIKETVEDGNIHVDPDGAPPVRHVVLRTGTRGHDADRTQGADAWQQLISLSATELDSGLILVAEGLQVGALLKGKLEKLIFIDRRSL